MSGPIGAGTLAALIALGPLAAKAEHGEVIGTWKTEASAPGGIAYEFHFGSDSVIEIRALRPTPDSQGAESFTALGSYRVTRDSMVVAMSQGWARRADSSIAEFDSRAYSGVEYFRTVPGNPRTLRMSSCRNGCDTLALAWVSPGKLFDIPPTGPPVSALRGAPRPARRRALAFPLRGIGFDLRGRETPIVR